MRWICDQRPQALDCRVRIGFLFFPKKIGNEIRWLERAGWAEEYHTEYESDKGHWHNLRWIEYKIARAYLKDKQDR